MRIWIALVLLGAAVPAAAQTGSPSLGIDKFEHGAVAFFDLGPHLRLALWPRDSIAHDTGLRKSGHSPTEFTLGHNVGAAKEDYAVMARAK